MHQTWKSTLNLQVNTLPTNFGVTCHLELHTDNGDGLDNIKVLEWEGNLEDTFR